MIIYNPTEKIVANTLEIHYWFEDESHTMDALVQNRCEYEILGIIKEISNTLSTTVSIETEPFAEGGLRRWLKITSKSEKKHATITTAVITSLVITVLSTPLSKLSENLIDKLFEDQTLINLEKEKLQLEIEVLKQKASKDLFKINQNTIIKKKKSNFYEYLENYPKVRQVSYSISDHNRTTRSKEIPIEKKRFKKYILHSDELEPIEVNEAIIEIISPVLKKGKYKWTGYYKDQSISFTLKSIEFKTLVQNGKVEFKNGSSINCLLRIHRKMNNEGIIKITNYEVLRVNHYFEKEKTIETQEGFQYRKRKEGNHTQYSLFKDD
ncbi:hypothetical protein UJ101_00021 [Flavobacteriaceae bacterium UJ101]|nr:hypothetical protein UJ101_00021 [Flavobacteriaceae bacterium UJ101]